MTKTMTKTKTAPKIRTEMTLAHWTVPQQRLRLDAAVVDGVVPDQLSEPAFDPDVPDEMVAYDAIMATEDPWLLRLWSYNVEERKYEARWTELRLTISRRTISASLDTPAGVPVLWNHYSWGSPAAGRVGTMRAEGKKLVGTVTLSQQALANYRTSLDQIDAGMNCGASVGLKLLDQPKRKMASGDDAGTVDNADQLIYGRVRVEEVSLTATPMISQAGLLGRKQESK